MEEILTIFNRWIIDSCADFTHKGGPLLVMQFVRGRNLAHPRRAEDRDRWSIMEITFIEIVIDQESQLRVMQMQINRLQDGLVFEQRHHTQLRANLYRRQIHTGTLGSLNQVSHSRSHQPDNHCGQRPPCHPYQPRI